MAAKLGDAYRFDRQYMLGDQLLVAPVAQPGDPARKRVWFPPGRWVDLFTGEVHTGARAETLTVPLERMPIFARAGAIVPRQDYVDHVGRGAPDPLILNVYAGDDGRFTLYEDEGVGLRLPGEAVRAHAAALVRPLPSTPDDRQGAGALPGRPGEAPLQRPGHRDRPPERGPSARRRAP